MSIRMLAKDLYDLIKKVESLEKKIAELPPSSFEKIERLNEELRVLKGERDDIRRMLDGQKGS